MKRAELGHHVIAHFVSNVIWWIVPAGLTSVGALFLGLTSGLDLWQRSGIAVMFSTAIICTAVAAYAIGFRRRPQQNRNDSGTSGLQGIPDLEPPATARACTPTPILIEDP